MGRNLFRPLQYARAEIDLRNINYTARYIVHYSGMHLEAAARLILKNAKTFGMLLYGNTTLGKATRNMEKLDILDSSVIEALYNFIPLFNKSKH